MLPEIIGSFNSYTAMQEADLPSKTYAIDFKKGIVQGFFDRTDALKQALYKILQTPRFLLRVYSWNYGSEIHTLFGKSFEVVKSEIQRLIREAILQDGRFLDVTDFEIVNMEKQTVIVKFTAVTTFGNFSVERVVIIGV
jgi:phage baseplate assembly protein W